MSTSNVYVTADYASLADVPPFGTPFPGTPFRLENIVVRPLSYRRKVWWKLWTPRTEPVCQVTAEYTLPAPIDWRKDVRRRWAAYKVRGARR